MPTKKNLISGTCLTYKIITPYIKRKQNKFFWKFWNIGLVLVTLINWLLKPKCMLIHIFWNFLCCMKIWYDFFIFERLGRMHVNKTFYFIFIFLFLQKPGILILDLYFYSIKIQTNISKCNKIFAKNHKFF